MRQKECKKLSQREKGPAEDPKPMSDAENEAACKDNSGDEPPPPPLLCRKWYQVCVCAATLLLRGAGDHLCACVRERASESVSE